MVLEWAVFMLEPGKTTMKTNNKKISIIGYGPQAKLVIKFLKNIKDVDLHFILVKKNREIPNRKETSSIKNLLDSKIIYTCVPPKENYNIIKKLYKMKYKNYIISEKPVCDQLNQLKKILKFKKNFKEKIFVNFNFPFTKLAKLLNFHMSKKINGKIKLVYLNISHGAAFKMNKNHWRISSRLGPINGTAIHFIHFLKKKLGFYKVIYNEFSSNSHKNKKDTSDILLKFKNSLAYLHFSYSEPFDIFIKIIFDNSKIIYNGKLFKYYFKRNTFNKKGRFVEPKIVKKLNIDFYKDWNFSTYKNLKFIINLINKNKKNSINNINNDINILRSYYS